MDRSIDKMHTYLGDRSQALEKRKWCAVVVRHESQRYSLVFVCLVSSESRASIWTDKYI